jgi:hypothetical protein
LHHDIIVLESSAGCFGLLVDSVGEVLTVSSADHEPNPSILDAAAARSSPEPTSSSKVCSSCSIRSASTLRWLGAAAA